jgi:prolyl 4-hydroxylase
MVASGEPCKIMDAFLDGAKCQYIIDTFSDSCKRSTVVDAAGRDVVDPARTSSTFFMPNDDPVIAYIRQRCAAMAGVPESHVEGLQLVRYAKGEQYKFHYDYFDAIRHNQREHTFLVYLNDLEIDEGGATIFKNYGVKVYPRQGRCIWFRNMIDGKVNDKSLHAGEAVLSDKVKYAVNVWLREKPVDDYSSLVIKPMPANLTTGTSNNSSKSPKTSDSGTATTLGSTLFSVLMSLVLAAIVVFVGYQAYSVMTSSRGVNMGKWFGGRHLRGST